MKSVLFSAIGFAAVLKILVSPALAQVTVNDTTGPNRFYFTQTNHTLAPGKTNVVLEVRMDPGNRGFSGAVDFYTQDGTAEAGRDYGAVSGTLYMSWPGIAWIDVPIHPAALDAPEKSFQVFLSNTNAIIWNSPATVIVRSMPRLEIAHTGSSLRVSWPAAFDGCVLERSAAPNAAWEEVTAPAVLVADRWQVEEPFAGAFHFYRLRH